MMPKLTVKTQTQWNEEELDLLVRLGNALEEEYVFEQDYEVAYELYSVAADARDGRALNSLGWLTQNGLGTEKDVEEARYLYLAAAMRGNTTAMVNLGNGYEQGLFDGEPNYHKAVRWYWKAASEGDLKGLFNYANCYHHGWGVEKNHEKAFRIFKGLAENGDVAAAFYTGLYYQEGLVVEQNFELAREYYEQGAQDDDMYCWSQLGILYGNGLGVEKDIVKAVEYYKKAAELGDTLAYANIGMIYETGEIGEPDCEEAMKWYKIGADKRDEVCEEQVLRLQDPEGVAEIFRVITELE